MMMNAEMRTSALLADAMIGDVTYTPYKPEKWGVSKIKPNAKCPCGSGKKWKKCCKRKVAQRKNMSPSLQYLTENVTDLKMFMMEQMDFAPDAYVIRMVLKNRWENKNNTNKILSESKYVKKSYLKRVEEWCGNAPVKMKAEHKSLWGWENYCYNNAYAAACKYNMEHPENPIARVVMGLNITQLPDGAKSNKPGRRTSMETHGVLDINGKLYDVTPDFDGLPWKWFVPIDEWTKGCYNSSGGFKDTSYFNLYKLYIGEVTSYVAKYSGTRGFVYESNFERMTVHSLEDWDFTDEEIVEDMKAKGLKA